MVDRTYVCATNSIGRRNECHISKECRAPKECRAHTECQRNRAQQSRQHSVCKEPPRKGNCCARETRRAALAKVGQTLRVSQHLAVAEARAECLVPHCLHCLHRRASMPRCAYTHKPNGAGHLHSYTFVLYRLYVFTYAHACRCA